MLRHFVFLGLFLFALSLKSQTPVYQNLTDAEGLPSMLVYDLYVDTDGKLWLGTEEGIYWYDGLDFHKYVIPGARSTAVSGIVELGPSEMLFRNFSGQDRNPWVGD